jgi:large subunit ribosomal protein L29
MKPSEIRNMSPEEMERKVRDLKEEWFNLRFQHGISQLENPMKMKHTKRDIARIRTIMKEKQGEK